MKHIYASFQAAVEALIGDGPVKQRLIRAFEAHLSEIDQTELPSGVRAAFRDLHAALHVEKPIGPLNQVRATVHKMSSAEASRHALSIFSMFVGLQGRKSRSEPLRVTEPLQFAERAIAAAPRYLDKQD